MIVSACMDQWQRIGGVSRVRYLFVTVRTGYSPGRPYYSAKQQQFTQKPIGAKLPDPSNSYKYTSICYFSLISGLSI